MDWSGDGEGDGGDASLDVPVAADVGGSGMKWKSLKSCSILLNNFFNIETALLFVLNLFKYKHSYTKNDQFC